MNKRYFIFPVSEIAMPHNTGVVSFDDDIIIEKLKKSAMEGDKIILAPVKFPISSEMSLKVIYSSFEKGTIATLVEIEQIVADPFDLNLKLSYNNGVLIKLGKPAYGDSQIPGATVTKLTFGGCDGNLECLAYRNKAQKLTKTFLLQADLPSCPEAINISLENPVDDMDKVVPLLPIKDVEKYYYATTLEEKFMSFISMITLALDFMQIDTDVEDKVHAAIDSNQHEYYVREKIRILNSEIDGEDEVEVYIKQIEALKASEEVKTKLRKEARRINQTAPASPEMALLKNYLDTVLELPWGIYTDDNEDLQEAERVLNADHYGLEKVKERLIEALAVRKLSKEGRSPIICLVGPPGIGKTSIARSIATAMNKNYVRLSFGGVRDEAEIRGHRKTYVGAMPGRIITGLKTAGSMNPVFLIDEIDKMSSDYKGDPASALLEVLDPEQNKNFRDHFVEMSFDLSKVLFIVTANTLDTISKPLLDRMEVIEMSGYTDVEKMEIAKRYLVPKSAKQNGIHIDWITISDDAIAEIINSYTRESGVRGLEKSINAVMRKVARRYVSDTNFTPVNVTSDNLKDFLGEKTYLPSEIAKEDQVGVVNGLAWTAAGGDTLCIEVAVATGKGDLLLTGNLGDVMKESAKIALSYCRTHQDKLALAPDFFKEHDIHIHVPEGATPKDGPSAGVTITTAIFSALSGKSVKHDVAMTGEISLLGNVLPIGGLKEKSLAALRAGIKTIFLPEENRKDYIELPDIVKEKINFVFTKKVDTILENAINW